MDIRKVWLELALAAAAVIGLAGWALSQIVPALVFWWSGHWILSVCVCGLVGAGWTCQKWVPIAWTGFKSINDFIDSKKMQNEQLLLMSSVRERISLGDDTEYENVTIGIKFKIAVPKRTIVEEIEEEEEPLQIEAPGPADEHLDISSDYQPHADEFLSARKLVVGISGSGKSNTTATMCEELGRLDMPMVLADTENEYESLYDKRYLPHGVIVDSRTVNAENAAQFGQHILEQNIQAILNLQSYDEMEEAALVMVNMISGLKQWQEARANELRIPCEFILEEATTWLPQNIKESPLYGSDIFNQLQGTFFNDMVRKGRKRGLGLTVICQKIAEIDKRALQSEVKLLHRQTEHNDLKTYKIMGIENDEALSLQNGEGFYFSSRVSKMRIQVRQRRSEHGANTPGLSQLRQYQKSRNLTENQQADGEVWRNGFVPFVEPFESISRFPETPRKTVGKTVPERTKDAILGLYREGTKRTDIQGLLNLNGDEYWMVKAVCDEHDREGR